MATAPLGILRVGLLRAQDLARSAGYECVNPSSRDRRSRPWSISSCSWESGWIARGGGRRQRPSGSTTSPARVDIVGGREDLNRQLDDQRLQTVVYAVAKRTLDNHFRDEDGADRPWLYPQLVAITRRWIDECVAPYLKDHAYPQMLLLAEYSHAAADRSYQAIVAGHRGAKRLACTT